MDSANLRERVKHLEQELQMRQPGRADLGTFGSSFNSRGCTEALNYRNSATAAAASAPSDLVQPMLGFSLVAKLDSTSASSGSCSTSVSSLLHNASDSSSDEDSSSGGAAEHEPDPDSADRFVDVPLCDDVTDGVASSRSAASAKKRQSTASSAADSSAEFVEVSISDKKHPHAELPSQPPNLSGNRLRRRQIFETLLSTEASYLASLKELMATFQQPLLRSKQKLIARRHVRVIFHKIPELHQIHRILQISLHAAASGWDQSERIGHILAASFSKSLVLKAYASFLNNYTRAVGLLRRLLQENAAFATFASGMQRNSRHKLPLLAILVKPVQRFPQLLLVVKDLLRHTEQDHPDRYDLLYAQTQIESLTEQLNEIKRHSEQTASARQQLKSLGVNSKLALANSGVRLAREDAVMELRSEGAAESVRLLLTSYCVVCTAAKKPGGQQLLLWFARLEDVRLSATSVSPDMRVRLEEVNNVMRIISQRSEQVPAELAEIYESLHNLIHDHAVMVKVLSLVTSLKYIYPEAREDRLQRLVTNMQVAIQQKSEELRAAQGTVLSMTVRSKEKRQGKPSKMLKRSFDMSSAAAHDAWVSEFTTLRLALEPQNNAAWVTDSAEEMRALAHRCPLLVGVRACDLGKSSFSFTCATDVCLLNGSVLKTHLWCCANDGSVSICSLYDQCLEVNETFQAVDCRIVAVAVVPGGPGRDDEIWMATEAREIFIHSVAESRRRQPRRKVDVDSCVLCLLHHDGCVLCGDSDGSLVCFRRGLDGDWNLRDPETLRLAERPVLKLAVDQSDSQLLACAGADLLILELPDLRISRRARLCEGDASDDGFEIRDFLLLGECVWVCYEGRPLVRLYFCPDMQLVQSFDLQPAFAKLIAARSRQSQESRAPAATSLATTRGLLWIGTSEGLLYLLRLPRLDSGIPAAYGPPLISCHSHTGPTACLVAFRNIKDTVVSSVTFDEEDPEEEEERRKSMESSCQESPPSSDGSSYGVYQVLLSTAAVAAAADAADTSGTRRPTVAKLTVAPEMQRWASHPNLLLSEMQKQQQQQRQQQQQQQQEMQRLYGSLLELPSDRSGDVSDVSDDIGGKSELYQQQLMDSPQLSDIAEEAEGEGAGDDGVDGGAMPGRIEQVGPQILMSIGVGYRDMLRRPQCSVESGPTLMAFYAA